MGLSSKRTRYDQVICIVAAALLGACTITTGSASSVAPRPADRPAGPALPAVMQLYSPPLYRSFVDRSVPYQTIAEYARNASVRSRLRVREADTLVDDYYHRDGTVVMLGMEDGALVGFTTRYSVDIQYPADNLIRDGVGRPDFRESVMTLAPSKSRCRSRGANTCALRFVLEPLDRGKPRFSDQNTAYYRTLGDNDAVLVYFPASVSRRLAILSIESLGIERPSAEIESTVRRATQILGEEFLLVSPKSLKLLRKNIKNKSIVGTYAPEVISWAAGFFGANKIVAKLISRGVNYLTMDRRRIHNAVAYRASNEFIARVMATEFEYSSAVGHDESGGVVLPPLHLVDVPYENREQVLWFMQELVGEAEVELILFGRSRQAAHRGMMFVPSRHVNINYELIRNGLARLDTEHFDALVLFREFVDAAADALNEGAGYAAEWQADSEYVRAVRSLQARL